MTKVPSGWSAGFPIQKFSHQQHGMAPQQPIQQPSILWRPIKLVPDILWM